MNEHDELDIMDEEQMEDTIKYLVSEGLLKATWSSDRGEFLYSLTKKGLESANIVLVEQGEEE